MKWTTEKPAKPGWYWYRMLHHGKVNFLNIMIVFAYGDTFLARSTVATSEFVDKMRGEWAGPIQEPEEQV